MAVAAFYANANVKPAAPKDVIPYDTEAEHVEYDDFLNDFRRSRRRDGSVG
ncbi:MAG: hypothetical protein IKE69_08125 [Thermoguttaceae bacterium]|nr:hypothetical protein [Thermoguttaceae bacterium]